MTKAQDGVQKAGVETIGFYEVPRVVRSYLSERFPVVSQGSTVLSAFVCSYLIYGQVHGHQVFGWASVVGGVSAVLLALVRRIIDDIEDLREEILSGQASFTDGGRRQLRGLVFGAIAATALVGVLNATCSLGLLAVSLGVPAWFSVATVMKHTVTRSVGILFYIINESCPAAGLLYPYAVWHEVAGASLPTMAVVATVGLFWTTYQFWNFTRKAGGPEGWPPWGLSMGETRSALIAFLALAAVFSVLIAHYAHLSVGYLVYGPTLSVVFAAVILRWWSRLPAREPERVGASWAGGGLSFAVAVEAGLLLGVLVSAL